MEYIAFGEVLFEEHSSSFSMPYLFNGKELDRETNLSYYGARYLDMKTSLWLNIDPLAEKHPNQSPYLFCNANPIIYMDPDGRDGIRVIDDKNKTITIKAVYYVQTEKSTYYTTSGKMKTLDGYSAKEVASMQKDYNKYLNDLGMNVSDGEYKGYSIKYDLQFKEGGTIEASEASASKEMQDGYSIGNSFSRGNGDTYSRFKTKEIDNGDGTTSTSTVGGITADNKNILMNTSQDTKMNRVHEIFHTFGFGHPKGTGGNNGIMKYPPEKPNQADANNIGNGSFLPKVIVKQDGQN
ncbi:RHS repeat-associated core domain-containing protein [Flavobacterium columnare]|uniref:RHS repeat-associated core domain-containing protein n=2 Tax=Flavobacterium columnare TaxID=996 RepID=UPI003BA2EDD3